MIFKDLFFFYHRFKDIILQINATNNKSSQILNALHSIKTHHFYDLLEVIHK